MSFLGHHDFWKTHLSPEVAGGEGGIKIWTDFKKPMHYYRITKIPIIRYKRYNAMSGGLYIFPIIKPSDFIQ